MIRDKVETLFIASMLHSGGWQQVETATEHQDIFKHWDVKINGIRYDVKAAKKINRSDSAPQYDYTWVELRNVKGLGGWLVGEAEKIAFELQDEFLLVDRIALFELITTNLQAIVGKGPYERYQREDRSDLLTLVPVNDLRKIDSYSIPKFKLDEQRPTGEDQN
jgi:hypothetical protein